MNDAIPSDQLAALQGTEKQSTGPGPKGCDENGPAAALLVGHVSIQIP
jgi:hypothetical protein